MAAMVRIVDAYCGNCGIKFSRSPELDARIPFEVEATEVRVPGFVCGYCTSRNVLIATEPVDGR